MIKHIAYLFDKIKNDEEVLKWIRDFSYYQGPYAVLKISGASLHSNLNNICDDLAVLSKLDLNSPIVYGWGNAFTEKLKSNGINTEVHTKTGVRITNQNDLPYLEEIAQEQGNLIVDTLKKRGVSSKIVYNVFTARKKNLEGVANHYTGNFVYVDTRPIIDCLDSKILPLLPPLGYEDGQLLNINGDNASKGLVLALQPRKYIIITNTGGVLNSSNEVIDEIFLDRDYKKLIKEGIIAGGMKVKVDEIKETIHSTPKDYDLEVQIANPRNLLYELFTDKGKGTYIQR